MAEGVRYYVWTPPATLDNPNISTPVATPVDSSTVYTVYGMNEHGGCRDTAMVRVDMEYIYQYIPSVFSPNGDGLNDVFRVIHLQYQRLTEFRVFDRWGHEVFSTTDPAQGWDGKYKGEPQDPGVYTYLIRVGLPNGRYHTYKGDITLMR
jgi:gliding motility-associated-like protein